MEYIYIRSTQKQSKDRSRIKSLIVGKLYEWFYKRLGKNKEQALNRKKKKRKRRGHLKNNFYCPTLLKTTAKNGSYTGTVQDTYTYIYMNTYIYISSVIYDHRCITTRRSYSAEMELVILQGHGMESVRVFLRTWLSPSSGPQLISLLVSLRDNYPVYIGSSSCNTYTQGINIIRCETHSTHSVCCKEIRFDKHIISCKSFFFFLMNADPVRLCCAFTLQMFEAYPFYQTRKSNW